MDQNQKKSFKIRFEKLHKSFKLNHLYHIFYKHLNFNFLKKSKKNFNENKQKKQQFFNQNIFHSFLISFFSQYNFYPKKYKQI